MRTPIFGSSRPCSRRVRRSRADERVFAERTSQDRQPLVLIGAHEHADFADLHLVDLFFVHPLVDPFFVHPVVGTQDDSVVPRLGERMAAIFAVMCAPDVVVPYLAGRPGPTHVGMTSMTAS